MTQARIAPGLRYPSARVLLPRTRLAYVHLRNLLTDAKRDRAARVSGYVAIWLPEEFLLLYLLGGELATATVRDARGSRPIALAAALERVPAEPEYGEICFHEAHDDLLAAIYATQVTSPLGWPQGVRPSDPAALFPYLQATLFDGIVGVTLEGAMHLLRFHDGAAGDAWLVDGAEGQPAAHLARVFATGARAPGFDVQRWKMPPPLLVQAPTALLQAYRALVAGLVARLTRAGVAEAAAIAEESRAALLPAHPSLDGFAPSGRLVADPVVGAPVVTRAVAAWVTSLLGRATAATALQPGEILREVAWERRHLLQSAGFFDLTPWRP